MEPTFELWDILHLIAAAQGGFIGVLFLFSRKGNRWTNSFLGLLLVTFSYRLFEITAFWTRLDLIIPHILETSFPFSYAFGVLLYFYVRHLVSGSLRMDRRLWVHLIPFIVVTISMFPFYFSGAQVKIDIISSYFETGVFENEAMPRWKVYLQFPHLFTYTSLAIFMLQQKMGSLSKVNEESIWRKLKHIRNLIIGFGACYFLWMLSFIGIPEEFITARLYDYLSISGMILFIYSMGYQSFQVPEVHVFPDTSKSTKYANSTLDQDQAVTYLNELKILMEKDRLFLRQDLSLAMLSQRLNLSPHLLSQIINERYGHNFFDFVNQYRIAEAQRMLTHEDARKYTIASIAQEVGFNNKTSFNNYFKKVTGKTPSTYRKEAAAGGDIDEVT